MPTSTKKRAATDDGAASSNGRAAKVQKTANGKKAVKPPAMSASEFQVKALPLHVNITHTPPSIEKKDNKDDEKEETPSSESDAALEATLDPGLIGSLTLLPNTFSTGSYGWKGARRIVVELQNGKIGEDGKREKVQVMLTINATVLGSKPAGKADDDESEKADKDEEAEASEAVSAEESKD
ncbi:hypothetical protein CC1G_10844 [Coprinopsis cinerea okayama7|uniref:Uncharacterized protein n=1 Tax=Coprinopsis cinerea (strain Okayama-7 / 130 / ATCC MYA-4618 / FGSC 9003) TaxID=240176 RepID=A8NHJ9_COPC7|nr:hypothetical protein CC1G_10844 [Coprinopsis cinerea okayama7\|eukprot:XP_001833779.1 hypothetical protein CC1G_10844 [Coprinopsis cinerea okayama7\